MKEQMDKQLENLVGKVVKDFPLESPSVDFTSNVMSEVNNLSQLSSIVHKPLIPKSVLVIVGLLLSFLFLYLYLGNTTIDSGWFSNLNVLSGNGLSELIPSIKLSKTFIYSLVLFGVMFLIQLNFMKGYLDKRLEI